ncbi:23S rRNA (uracil(1939)-C(5))-methyltransferase RlmD [Clostridium sp. Marseille-Q2269]|uniref:23S rRNA (uracil(1939)-C(5))-methyltransferase RlmD n=1 Tax=Clostridium sp. Marseille-Q2269 TaxID=2942205 RepID=UPI0020748D63|nr:23S rRNA (uracil(1939)-C(5))-methyltransferase RlmD [Clostridium sp. Marseille-Q2269]
MKKNIPVEKNKEYNLDIIRTGFEGEGVSKIEDFTVFIPGALEGENALTRIVKVNKNFAFGKIVKLNKESENRVDPVCPIYKQCGGCHVQHYSYKSQLDFKKQRVIDCLQRIGKLNIDNIEIEDTIGMDKPYRYRNKIQMPVRLEKGEIKIGFYKPRTHEVVDVKECLIQDDDSDKIIKIIREWMKKYSISAYNEETGKGLIRHIMIRKAFKNKELMLVIVTNKGREIPYIEALINEIVKEIPNIKSIIQNINSKKTNVVLGGKCITLWGKDTITDYIDKFKFNISPLSFFQVNPIQTEVLYKKALEFANLKGEEIVFDAYCGTGTISLFLSQMAKKVYGVEIIKESIDNAKDNAKENNLDNVEFLVGKSEEVIPNLINQGIKADVVVVDPPRKGCEKSLLEAIASSNPKRIVYVSCDPGTLARDLGILKELGYNTEKVQPVDMFPQTSHVENVVRLSSKTI